jgi:hypothetical protein
VHRSTIAELPRSPQLPAPTLLVVGEVVRFADPAALLAGDSSATDFATTHFTADHLTAAHLAGNEEPLA